MMALNPCTFYYMSYTESQIKRLSVVRKMRPEVTKLILELESVLQSLGFVSTCLCGVLDVIGLRV